jgi:P27 family predicted phage terminase small subunit
MGQRGPHPMPTKILALRGSWRAKTRPQEPQPPPARPTCPAWLDRQAKAVWRQLIPRLATFGLLSQVDGAALARYCVLTVRWRGAMQFIQQYGETYPIKNEQGAIIGMQPFPQTWIMKSLGAELLRLEREFGMTPSARAALGMHGREQPPEESHAEGPERFFRRPAR